MKNHIKIIFMLFSLAMTAATGYSNQPDRPTARAVIQTVQADMPAAQEYAFFGWDTGEAVTYGNQQPRPFACLPMVANKCLGDLLEYRYTATPAGPIPNVSSLCTDMSTEYKTCIAANTGVSVVSDIGRRSRIPARSYIDTVPPDAKFGATVRSGTGHAVRV